MFDYYKLYKYRFDVKIKIFFDKHDLHIKLFSAERQMTDPRLFFRNKNIY